MISDATTVEKGVLTSKLSSALVLRLGSICEKLELVASTVELWDDSCSSSSGVDRALSVSPKSELVGATVGLEVVADNLRAPPVKLAGGSELSNVEEIAASLVASSMGLELDALFAEEKACVDDALDA